jgi:hypothetical protein
MFRVEPSSLQFPPQTQKRNRMNNAIMEFKGGYKQSYDKRIYKLMSINNMSIHECFDDYKSRETSIAIEIQEQGVEKFKVAMDFEVDPRAQYILHVYILSICSILLTLLPLTGHCFFVGVFFAHNFFNLTLKGFCQPARSKP